MRKREGLPAELEDLLRMYRGEGLIPPDFEPQGEFPGELRASIKSRAYIGWIAKHGNGSLSVEAQRSMFLNRHNPGWVPPVVEEPAPLPLKHQVEIEGFDRVDRVLPRGDAWEGPDPDQDGDIPPPGE